MGVSEAELSALENTIAANPTAGDVIKGLGGARKIRFAFGGKGKSGGGRAIYVTIQVRNVVYLVLAYAKSAQTDLSHAQRKAVLELLEILK